MKPHSLYNRRRLNSQRHAIRRIKEGGRTASENLKRSRQLHKLGKKSGESV